MLHTSGFPHAPLGPPRWADARWPAAGHGQWRSTGSPASSYEYHPTSAHWVLAEIIDRVTGGDFRDELERRITGPLGLGPGARRAPDQQGGIADWSPVGEPASPEELEAAFGMRELPVPR